MLHQAVGYVHTTFHRCSHKVPSMFTQMTYVPSGGWIDTQGLYIEWVYDIVVPEGKDSEAQEQDLQQQVISVSILPGASCCDLLLPDGAGEGVAFRGEPAAMLAWIKGLVAYGHTLFEFKDGLVTLTTRLRHINDGDKGK